MPTTVSKAISYAGQPVAPFAVAASHQKTPQPGSLPAPENAHYAGTREKTVAASLAFRQINQSFTGSKAPTSTSGSDPRRSLKVQICGVFSFFFWHHVWQYILICVFLFFVVNYCGQLQYWSLWSSCWNAVLLFFLEISIISHICSVATWLYRKGRWSRPFIHLSSYYNLSCHHGWWSCLLLSYQSLLFSHFSLFITMHLFSRIVSLSFSCHEVFWWHGQWSDTICDDRCMVIIKR